MGGIWLLDLPDVVRDAGLSVRTWPGWDTRGRSSGGYDAVLAVFAHHTASSTSPDGDCRYMWEGSPDRPIGAMLLDRGGRVTVGAAGATNTQGKGGPVTTSVGTIPLDKGNVYGLAVEAANNGVGEPWPTAQQEAYVVLVAALCDAYGLDVARDCISHREWCEPSCPGRKVDPAGPSRWATGTASWDMDTFRNDAANQEDDMLTPADIDAIAAAVSAQLDYAQIAHRLWTYPLGDIITQESMPAGDLLRYARRDAREANVQTDP
jgi:hypothetical protein